MLPAMAKIQFFAFILLYVASNCISVNVDNISSDVRIKNVDRSIDISSQLVKISSKITFENAGKVPVKQFLLAVEGAAKNNLAFIGARDSNNKDLRLVETTVKGHDNVKFYRVELKEPVNAAASVVITSDAVFSKALLPHPTAITQQEDQLVKYNKKELSLHYKNNSPFLTVTRLERLIEVSHWGNIAIEEIIEIEHSGAKLKGPFSRYDYQQDHHSGPASVRSYKTLLPASASDVYYRDTNGNISTSNMKVKKDSVELDLRPRYPLFGGWRSHYTLGYNVPSYEYLYHSGNEYLLKMRAVDHVFDDMQIDELVTKIILPEGSTNIKINFPFAVTRLPDSLHYTYLDTKGRPVITFKKSNVVENHIQDFQLRYTFPRILMLQEPLLVVGFLYALFLCVIVYVRLDFSIHKPEHLKE
ncbi:unnamed protein product [Danaus chrysippus]|uniref:Dolichyl-diphosphooligosaccharide--protein glycosyltransferase subunit 1 n=1 Tax=Danaus chrysippus TaxID=151541 RepID=A0A8J2VVU9_9NEOP|nr:unnamed protein product [Danaus chrysippus]